MSEKTKKVRFKGTPFSDRIAVPFFSIQSPMFEKTEHYDTRVLNPKIDVPPSISAEDMEIYSREAELGGMTVTRSGWDTIEILEGPEKAVFKRTGEDYVLDGVFRSGLSAYEMPLTKIVEQNAVKDIQATIDYDFVSHIEAAVKAKENE